MQPQWFAGIVPLHCTAPFTGSRQRGLFNGIAAMWNDLASANGDRPPGAPARIPADCTPIWSRSIGWNNPLFACAEMSNTHPETGMQPDRITAPCYHGGEGRGGERPWLHNTAPHLLEQSRSTNRRHRRTIQLTPSLFWDHNIGMTKLFWALIFVSAISGLIGCGSASDQNSYSVIHPDESVADPQPGKKNYSAPEIGMPFADFAALCFPPGEYGITAKDDIREISTADAPIGNYHVRLADDPDRTKLSKFRADRGCIGIFSFRAGRLNSMTRSSF